MEEELVRSAPLLPACSTFDLSSIADDVRVRHVDAIGAFGAFDAFDAFGAFDAFDAFDAFGTKEAVAELWSDDNNVVVVDDFRSR